MNTTMEYPKHYELLIDTAPTKTPTEMKKNTALTYLEAVTLKEVLHDAITNWNGETEWPCTMQDAYDNLCEATE